LTPALDAFHLGSVIYEVKAPDGSRVALKVLYRGLVDASVLRERLGPEEEIVDGPLADLRDVWPASSDTHG
jgi:hypothetical protein